MIVSLGSTNIMCWQVRPLVPVGAKSIIFAALTIRAEMVVQYFPYAISVKNQAISKESYRISLFTWMLLQSTRLTYTESLKICCFIFAVIIGGIFIHIYWSIASRCGWIPSLERYSWLKKIRYICFACSLFFLI